MKKVEIWMSEDTLAKLRAKSLRSKGSVGFESTSEGVVLTFREYKKNKSQHRHPMTLLTLPSGWLRKTARRFQFHLSLNDELGEQRAAEELERNAEEARQFLKHLSNIMQIV